MANHVRTVSALFVDADLLGSKGYLHESVTWNDSSNGYTAEEETAQQREADTEQRESREREARDCVMTSGRRACAPFAT